MNAEIIWTLFLKTGLPESYLLYRSLLEEECISISA